jgi:SNF2 family DNA or RNA helicase
MYMLDRGEALGDTFSKFQRRWFIYTGPPRYELLLKPRADREIMEAVKHKFFRLKAEDYLDMPKQIFNEIPITLPKKAVKMYNEFKKEAIIKLDTGTKITAVSAAAACNKLRQISQGALYHEDGKTFTEVHDQRVKALRDLKLENEGVSILVACQFKFEIAMLKKAFGNEIPVIAGGCSADKASEYINQWNRGELPMLFCHPASISHGVNLQDGGSIVLWYGIPWSLEQYTQLIGRLYRQGQKRGVVVHHFVGTPTDRRILKALHIKNQTQAGFLEAIKEAIYA